MTGEIYHTIADLYAIADAVAGQFVVRDPGLLTSALARPRTYVFGVDVYPTLWEKAAALLQSLAGNHPLVDGNKRLALAAAVVFLARNGVNTAALDEDAAYNLMIAVAKGELEEVPILAERLAAVLGAQHGG